MRGTLHSFTTACGVVGKCLQTRWHLPWKTGNLVVTKTTSRTFLPNGWGIIIFAQASNHRAFLLDLGQTKCQRDESHVVSSNVH